MRIDSCIAGPFLGLSNFLLTLTSDKLLNLLCIQLTVDEGYDMVYDDYTQTSGTLAKWNDQGNPQGIALRKSSKFGPVTFNYGPVGADGKGEICNISRKWGSGRYVSISSHLSFFLSL